MKNFNPKYFNLNKIVIFHDKTFKLRTVIVSRKLKIYKLCGYIISRHGRSQFIGWWFNGSTQNAPIQVDDLSNDIQFNDTYTLAYFSLDDSKVDAMREKLL